MNELCPLRNSLTAEINDEPIPARCMKELCSWWNNTECCIKTISIELIKIQEAIQDTALPKATQINVRKK
mgnify:FL=1